MFKTALLSFAVVAAGFNAAHAEVVVFSKIDTEGGVSGQIILQLLETGGNLGEIISQCRKPQA